MHIKVSCTYNNGATRCKNKNIKRSLWRFGARCCLLYDKTFCRYQVKSFISAPPQRMDK
jgi:hypothetical protein